MMGKIISTKWILFSFLTVYIVFSSSFVSAGLLAIVEKHFQLVEPRYLRASSYHSQKIHHHNTDLRFLFQESENFIKTDLRNLIAHENRKDLLNNYIADGKNLSQTLNYHYSFNKPLLQNSKSQQSICRSQLNSANDKYKTAIKYNQETLYDQAIIEAKQARACLGENAVNISSLEQLTKKILIYYNMINKRTNYLIEKQEIIINNYALLDQNKLLELNKISTILTSSKP